MCFSMIWYGVILVKTPDVFYSSSHAQIYINLTQLATAQFWGSICLTIGFFRFIALFVNGTFPSFQWSPYLRAVSSFASVLFWLQIVLGAFASHLYDLALNVYITFMILDAFSLFIAASESGAIVRESEGG